MRKILFAIVFAFVLSFIWRPVAAGEIEKQGVSANTSVYSGTYKVIPLEEGTFVMPWEHTGVVKSDAGKGPFHDMTHHGAGIFYIEKGEGRLLGYEVRTDPEGDKIILEYKEDPTSLKPGLKHGTGKFLGGTGKFSGIEGDFEYTRYNLRPTAEGTYQGVANYKCNWKVP
jgi:hypothetical protein